ncbi:MAG: hypothetical protein IKQ44_10925 [Lachnospiraceae bacterium]|nr:hypothetical protein [Lachnospiraceae bacterium]
MSKNLVKSYFATKESSTPRVIDGNITVEQSLERIKYIFPDGVPAQNENQGLDEGAGADAEPAVFSELDAEMVKGLVDDNEPDNEADSEAAQSNVIKANPVKEEIPSEAQVRAEVEELKHRLVEEALADIAVMKNQAAEEVARDKAIALEAAKSEGYQEGRNTGYMELEEERRRLEEDKRKHEEEYSELLFELEPKFVRYITNIYEKVFQVDLSEEKNIVVNLLRNAMQKVEGSKNYIVHVSKEDYKFVYERKKELADAAMAEDVIIDVVEDLTMKSGDALIETANGIFDCGVETQLTAIKKKLMLLAYNGE